MAAGTMSMARGLVVTAACFAQAGTLARCTEEPPPSAKEPVKPAPKPETKPADTKPADAKPTEAKPSDVKPPDVKPVDTSAAPKTEPAPTEPDPYTTPANPTLAKTDITLAGRVFHLEQALTVQERYHGLSGRTEIPADGGMIFVFKQPRRMEFVMRDCPADIDIIFVNQLGRITMMHHMAAGPRRTEEQRKLSPPANYPDAPKWAWSNESYEQSLKKYSSRYDACVVIELKGGTLKLSDADKGTLALKPNEKLDIDIKTLQDKAE